MFEAGWSFIEISSVDNLSFGEISYNVFHAQTEWLMFSMRFRYHSNNPLSPDVCWHRQFTHLIHYRSQVYQEFRSKCCLVLCNLLHLYIFFSFEHFWTCYRLGITSTALSGFVCRKIWSCFVRYIDCVLVTGLSCPQNVVAWRGTIWNYNWNVVHSDGGRQNYKMNCGWRGSSWSKGRNKMWNQYNRRLRGNGWRYAGRVFSSPLSQPLSFNLLTAISCFIGKRVLCVSVPPPTIAGSEKRVGSGGGGNLVVLLFFMYVVLH